jgi:hypothetical protein
MGIDPSTLNGRQVGLMSKADRKRLGRETLPETIARYSDKLERALHDQYIGFLHRHGFKPYQILHSHMNKKSTLPVGFPDFMVLRDGKTLLVEFKVGANVCSPEQEVVIADLIAQGFCVKILYTYSEAISETSKFFNL